MDDTEYIQSKVKQINKQNSHYFRDSTKKSFFEKHTFKNKDFTYCVRNIPSYVSMLDEDNVRATYETKRNTFMKDNSIESISNRFMNSVFNILDKNNLHIKDEKAFEDDMRHFIYMYSTT